MTYKYYVEYYIPSASPDPMQQGPWWDREPAIRAMQSLSRMCRGENRVTGLRLIEIDVDSEDDPYMKDDHYP